MAPPALKREVAIASGGILLLLFAVKVLGALLPSASSYIYTVGTAAQLYVPVFLIGRRGITWRTLGLDRKNLWPAVRLGAILGALTFLPYAGLHYLWFTEVLGRTFSSDWASNVVSELEFGEIALEFLVVALSEELFFRGYLQQRMELLWPSGRRVFRAPFGKAAVFGALVFALAHFVGEWNFTRLGPFFPALVFAWLRARHDHIAGAIVYHALCNLMARLLTACY